MTTHTRLLILAVMTCALPMTAMAQLGDAVPSQAGSQEHPGMHRLRFRRDPRAHVHGQGRAGRDQVGGGIDDEMKLVRPNVYQTVFQLAGVRLDVVADLA